MSWRVPEILETLFDVPLRNGNLHRLQVVRFGPSPHAVVLLEVREIVKPENLRDTRTPPDFDVKGPDGRMWGAARPKGFRADHVEWMTANSDRVLSAMRRARAATLADGAHPFGGHLS